ncbi:MAG: MBL fold metallo-hydrolase [Candidatus Syntropharchaeia archaeon]
MRLIKNLYWYGYQGFENNGNSCFFDDEIGTLVDPGHLFNLRNLIASLRKDGFNVKDIDLIVLTHLHPDHYEATEAIREMSGAKVSVHRKEYELFRIASSRISGLPPFNPDFYLGDTLRLGEVKLEIIHTPGHSPGSVSLYWRKEKVLITGDVVFYRGIGRTDIPGGDPKALKESIEKLSALDVEYLLPGHNYGLPMDHPGYIKGRENVKKNFEYIKSVYFSWL